MAMFASYNDVERHITQGEQPRPMGWAIRGSQHAAAMIGGP
jgi:hypothetical protein